MDVPTSEMIYVAGQHDGFQNDQEDPYVTEVKDYEMWDLIGDCPAKHFPQPELSPNPLFAEIVSSLDAEVKDAYSYAPCDKVTLKRCFKQFADVSIPRPSDIGEWCSFFQESLAFPWPKS